MPHCQHVDFFHFIDECCHTQLLGHKMVGVGVAASLNVAFSDRAGKRDDRHVLQSIAAPDFVQHFVGIELGNAEVDQDDIGLRRMVEFSSLTEILHRVVAVFDHVKVIRNAGNFERLFGHADVSRIVFNQQDVDRFTRAFRH